MKFPKISEVAHELRAVNRSVDGECDVRLQVYPDGQWAVRWGLSDYDQDHHGYWGSSSIPGSSRRFHSEDMARDLIEQCRSARADDSPPIAYLDPAQVTDTRETSTPHNRSRTGYGSKIPTAYQLRIGGRWHRVYCICWSNSGSLFVVTKQGPLFLGSYDPRMPAKEVSAS